MSIYENYREEMGVLIDANADGIAQYARELVADLQVHLADDGSNMDKASTIIEVTRYYLNCMENVNKVMQACGAKYQAITFAIENKED